MRILEMSATGPWMEESAWRRGESEYQFNSRWLTTSEYGLFPQNGGKPP